MIHSNQEYQQAAARLAGERRRLDRHRARLRKAGLSKGGLKAAMDPMESFHLQLAEEIDEYERTRRGEFPAILNLQGLGRLLVGLRIASGLSQRELAERLGVHESQISRDERNEYFGVKAARVSKILDVLGVRLTTTVEAATWNGSPRGR